MYCLCALANLTLGESHPWRISCPWRNLLAGESPKSPMTFSTISYMFYLYFSPVIFMFDYLFPLTLHVLLLTKKTYDDVVTSP